VVILLARRSLSLSAPGTWNPRRGTPDCGPCPSPLFLPAWDTRGGFGCLIDCTVRPAVAVPYEDCGGLGVSGSSGPEESAASPR
jgi:hypothetical protein